MKEKNVSGNLIPRNSKEGGTSYKMIKCGKKIEEAKDDKVTKKNTDEGLTISNFISLMIDEKVGRTKNEESIRVLILHHEEDSELAKILADCLNKTTTESSDKETKFRVMADCQLYVFKMMCFVSYITAAIEWANVVVILNTKSYLEDIKSVGPSIWCPSGTLHTRHGFKVLQNKVDYDNSFPVIVVAQEGTQHDCHEFVEAKKCVHVKKDISELRDTIYELYQNSLNRAN